MREGGARAVGMFIYEHDTKVDFEDRLLLHLQRVISTKLRRGEAFHFSWRNDPSLGEGRTTIWLHPSSMLVYRYYGSKVPTLNPAWLEALLYTANSTNGLYVVPEPQGSVRNAESALL
jgi:hypothetical protein